MMSDYLSYSLYNNTLEQLFVAILLFFVIKGIVELFNRRAVTSLKALESRRKSQDLAAILMGYVVTLPQYFLISLYLFLPLKVLILPPLAEEVIDVVMIGLVTLQVIRLFMSLFTYTITQSFKKEDQVDTTTINAITLVVHIVVRSIGLIMFLMNLGVQVSPLIASLGIGGIAVAFALQNILQDLFASFSLFFDRPFKIGDYIGLGADQGTVKDITFKSTRIETPVGQEITIPNKEVMNLRINNFERMVHRRLTTLIQITYDNNLAEIQSLPTLLKELTESIADIRFDKCFCRSFEDGAANFELTYFVKSPRYHISVNTQHQLTMLILKTFEEKNMMTSLKSLVTTDELKK